jgi:hypothetical protein
VRKLTGKGPRVVHIDREGLTEGETRVLEEFLTFVTEACVRAINEGQPDGEMVH